MTILSRDKILMKFDDGQPINLEQMLLAKEKRVENQMIAINRYHYPVISLSLVIPGAIKNSSGSLFLFKEAITALHNCFIANAIALIDEQHYHYVTGSEAIISVPCSIDKLKQLCIDIEDNHPLGRLWDIDVIDPLSQRSVSRSKFNHRSRQCLVCQEAAKICSRAKKHSLEEIFLAIERRIKDYLDSSSLNASRKQVK